MFKENDFYQFKDFTACEEQRFSNMKRKKDNGKVPFNSLEIKLLNNTLLFYQFMRNNNNEVMAKIPDQWVREDFKT